MHSVKITSESTIKKAMKKIYPNFKTKKNYLPQKIFGNSIMLPNFPGIKKSEIKHVSDILISSIK